MKTIKELEIDEGSKEREEIFPILCIRNKGYKQALKDVLELIDELECYYKGQLILPSLELKARIEG